MVNPNIQRDYAGIPSTALVMGGNWENPRSEDNLLLSNESRMRVLALGVLASNELVDAAIFTAGLTHGSPATPESSVQRSYLLEQFPRLSPIRLLEEDLGHTTRMDAIYTAELIAQEGSTGPFTLITSQAFLKRQTKVFEREGFDIEPVAAEPLVASLSDEYRACVRRYVRSPRNLKIHISEAILRGLGVIDPESKITEWLATRSRPNHQQAG